MLDVGPGDEKPKVSHGSASSQELQFRAKVTIRCSKTAGFVVGLRAGASCDEVCLDVAENQKCVSVKDIVLDVEYTPLEVAPHPADWKFVEFRCTDSRPWKLFVGQQTSKGCPHGTGLLVFADGGMHIGEFVDADATGFGMHYFPEKMFKPRSILIGSWRNNKPHNTVVTLQGHSLGLCRFQDGSAYGVGWQDDDRLSFNSRPPKTLAEPCPSLGQAMKAEVLEAAEAVKRVLDCTAFLAHQHSLVAAAMLKRLLGKIEERRFS